MVVWILEDISKIENTRVASNPWHPKGRNFLENGVPLLACKQCETIFEMASWHWDLVIGHFS
jgi:hypothetical protein